MQACISKMLSFFAAESKAKELSALLKISKEITSTLDLDAVLMSIVNLSAHVIPYENATISLAKRGSIDEFEIKSISGEREIDEKCQKIAKLQQIHNLVAGLEQDLILSSKDDLNNIEMTSKDILEQYLNENELESFAVYVLKDDQGILGVFSMESIEKNMIQASRQELLSILIGQSTVALRNAELYNIIPSNNMFGGVQNLLSRKAEEMKNYGPMKWMQVFGAICITICAFIFLKVPHHVQARVEVFPLKKVYYSFGEGNIEKIHVEEGQQVKKGDLLLEISNEKLDIELAKKVAQKQKVVTEMMKFKIDQDIAQYKIKEKEKLSLDKEIELVEIKLKNSKVFSSFDGVVISKDLDDLIGKPVKFGDELIQVSSSKDLFVQFEVPEEDILEIKTGQEVKFKLFGMPTTSFSEQMKVESVAGEATQLTEQDPNKYFIAKARINTGLEGHGEIKAGMTGRGKIYADWVSLGYKVFSAPMKFLATEVFF